MARSSLSVLAVLAPLVMVGACKKAVPTAVTDDPLAEPLPIDPDVRRGVYANGMKWYVEQNGHPDDRVVFRLAVDAGSALEDDDQQGLAHLLEHMAFNGTTSFPGTALVTYLESLGTRFGPHLNAHTSFDETVYKLTVPSDDEQAVSTALKVLEEWACCMTLDPAEIERERGVVLEEWRRRLGPSSRISDQTVPLTYWGSPYATRLPIGTEESLRTFTPDAVKRYHTDWYRPDRMAIIAVGDVDPDALAARLEAHFAKLESPAERREREEFSLPEQEGPFHVVIADPEVTRTSVQVIRKHDHPQSVTVGDYRRELLAGVALGVLNERLGEIARTPDAPWLGAGVGVQRLMPTEGADTASATVSEGGVLRAYEALLTEVERFRRHGVTEPELARMKASTLKRYETLLQELETTESVRHADEIVRHFLAQESMPGTVAEVDMARRFVPELTKAEVDAWAARFLTSPSSMVTVIQPEKDGLDVPTVDALKAVEARVAAADVGPPASEDAITALVESPPAPGTIASTDTTHLDTLGFTGWTLSNGARVWWKRTDFKNDEVVMRAWRDGGTSAVSDADYPSVQAATAIRGASGLGEHDPNAILRFLQGKRAGVSESFQGYGAGLGGSMSPADLEVGLQLAYLVLTAPRFTEEGEALTLERWRTSLLNRDKDPNTAFSDAWSLLLWPDDPRSRPFALEDLENVDRAAAERLHRQAFSDPSDFTFVFVGALPEGFEAQVLTWIGGIPKADAGIEVKDRGFRRKDGDLRVVVEKGLEQKARFRTEYWGAFPANTWESRNRLYALADVLSVLLRERLREELGGVYGVTVSADEWYEPDSGYRIRVEFVCDPERVEELERETRAVLEKVVKDGIEARYVDAEIAKNRQQHQESIRTNGWWLGAFAGALDRGADPAKLLEYDARNEALTAGILHDRAREWLKPANRATAVLLPAPSP